MSVDEERVRSAIEHAQSAALEAIAAGRAVLDLLEDLVRDPTELATLVSGLGEAAQAAVRVAADAAANAGHDGGRPGDQAADGDVAGHPPPTSQVEHIRIT